MKDQLAKIAFAAADLRKVAQHAGFLVASSLAVNEINILQRAFLMALNTRSKSRPIQDAALQEIAYSQSAVIERNLSAKILEYMNLVGDYPKICTRAKVPPLDPFATKAAAAIGALRTSPGYDLALWYRNKVTSHYVVSDVVKLITDEDIGEPDHEHSMYLHQSDGNSAYLLGERIVLAKLGADKGDAVQKMRVYGDWVMMAVKQVMSLHHDFCIQFLRQLFPDRYATKFSVEIEPHLVGHLTNALMPIFWDMKSKPAPVET
ncbi:hypothetical protein JS562_13665 [Agrobacterium sp. S2]|nr:hypothetical protein [Agrobacterium sp. S2]